MGGERRLFGDMGGERGARVSSADSSGRCSAWEWRRSRLLEEKSRLESVAAAYCEFPITHLLYGSDVKQSASIFRGNVRHIRHWLEQESATAAN